MNKDKEKDLIGKLQANIKNGTKTKKSLEALHKEGMPFYIAQEKSRTTAGDYEMVDHPKHYNNYDVEVVDMMEKIWGTKATMEWCKMTAYKYRMRMGTKPSENDSSEAMKAKLLEDFNKEQWYLKKADELKSKLFDKGIDMNQ